ncbi:MAG: VCBS repeat-containing protein [Bacteroidota bacterium]
MKPLFIFAINLLISYSITAQISFEEQQRIAFPLKGLACLYGNDLDGDGNNDIIASAYSCGRLSWFKNLGNMVFAYEYCISSNYMYLSAISFDVDNDGDNDIIAGSSQRIELFRNLGNGKFSNGMLFYFVRY